MNKCIDKELIKQAVKQIILALGDDPEREGLKDTPDRVSRMYCEVFEGMLYTNDEIAELFKTNFEENKATDMVVETNIPIFSYCEHHLALMYNMKVHVAHLPQGKVLGLSKIARIVDMVAKRLQLQERIGADIAEVMQKAIGVESVAVIIEAEHSCMTARGIKKTGTVTKTATLRGKFKSSSSLCRELYALI